MECNLDLFRELIKKKYKDNQDDIIKTLDSLDDRVVFTRYHYYSYKEDVGENWLMHSRANIVAFMQNLHASHDILGHLIYFLLDLKFGDTSYITLYKVIEKIDKSKYPNLLNLLIDLTEHDDFKYLNAYTNHSKHRHIVNPLFNLGISNIKEFGFSFDAFEYKNKKYCRRKVDDFLINEYNRESKLIIQIQNELIELLQKELT